MAHLVSQWHEVESGYTRVPRGIACSHGGFGGLRRFLRVLSSAPIPVMLLFLATPRLGVPAGVRSSKLEVATSRLLKL